MPGKQIQIQLTGVLEENAVNKFMREFWSLLLSTQQNCCGVPQQFLDAEEAAIQQRKEDIQKKREKDGRNSELEARNVTDGDAGSLRSCCDPVCSTFKNTNVNAEEDKDLDVKRSSRTKNRLKVLLQSRRCHQL